MKKIVIILAALLFALSITFIIVTQTKANEITVLKEQIQNYARENESLKIDLEMLRRKLLAAENIQKTARQNEFAIQQQQKFQAMREEIQRLKKESVPKNREKEDQIWDFTLENVKNFVDIELTKRLAGFGFKPEETEVCVTEYKNALAKSKDVLLQWYRNEITDAEYGDKIMEISREFYNDISASIGENLASITLSVVLPDYEFRKKMFEEK